MKTQQECQLYYWGPHYNMVKEYNVKHECDVKPWECVSKKHMILVKHPEFGCHLADYTFAVAILYDDKRKEHRPVFVGDRLWNGQHWVVIESDLYVDNLSWNPPKLKRTFKLNDTELPCPEKRNEGGFLTTICGNSFLFYTYQDFDEFKTKLMTLLTAARDKE